MVDTLTGEILLEHGKCEHLNRCGYTSYPKTAKKEVEKPAPPPSVNRIDDSIIQALAARKLETNSLFHALPKLNLERRIREVFALYKIGTTKDGSCVFPVIDYNGVCRSGKIIKYDANCKRIGFPQWLHKLLKIDNFEMKHSLFGEHLLNGNKKLVYLVESEKSALICAIFDNENIWCATGGKQGLTARRLWALSKREVIVYPDADAIAEWNDKLEKISENINFKHLEVFDWRVDIGDLLDENEARKADYADLILKKLNSYDLGRNVCSSQ